MSLLMDALKRAERSGQAPEADAADSGVLPEPEGELALEPAEAAAPPSEAAPEQTPALEPPPVSAAEPAPSAGASPAEAARIMAGSGKARPRPELLRMVFAGTSLLVVIAAVVVAYHYWNQRQLPTQPPELTLLGEVTPEPATAAAPDAVEDAAAVPAAAPVTADTGPLPGRAPDSELYAPVPRSVLRQPAPPAEAPAATREDPVREPVLQISRSHAPAREHRRLQDAWEALNAGRIDEAAALYAQVLRKRPRNRDALLGLAAVRVRQGDLQGARDHYRRVLALDPTDTTAHAGLAGLDGARDPLAYESRIKLLLRQNPDAAHLHFALGNLYARQRRWARAQQAYFDAVRLAPDNADYAFNLAVSLEHLDQPALALRYYRQAVASGRQRATGFDPAQATERIRQLEAAAGGGPA